MTRLGDCVWWPDGWVDDANHSFASSEIEDNAVLKSVRRTGNDLIVVVQHNNAFCSGKINSKLSEDHLILLRHILLQHLGESLSVVENAEVNFDGFD